MLRPTLPALQEIKMHAALWIGDAELVEFAPAAERLRGSLRLTVVPRIDDTLWGHDAAEYDVVILAEAVPGQNSPTSLERLRRRHAAAPFVRLCGPLCDGELRSSPPDATHRYRWLEAPDAFADDCEALRRGRCPGWGRPVTHGSEELVLESVADDPAVSLEGKRIGIDAHDPAVAAWLGDFLRSHGAVPVLLETSDAGGAEPDVVVWQAPATEDVAGLHRIRRTLPRAGIVALTAFPRRHCIERYEAAGAAAVAALPAIHLQLDRALARAAAHR
jgi:hypothetical protein